MSRKLRYSILSSTKGFWSGLFATVIGILLTVGVAEYQNRQKTNQMKHDLIVAALGDFYDFQESLNDKDVFAQRLIAVHTLILSRYDSKTHKLDATEGEMNGFKEMMYDNFGVSQAMSKASFFKNTSILDQLGDVVLLNTINYCYDYIQEYYNLVNDLTEIQKQLGEPYINRYMMGLPIDKDMIVATLESTEYQRFWTRFNVVCNYTRALKGVMEQQVQFICKLTGISLQEVLDIRNTEDADISVSYPYFIIPKLGLSLPMSSEVTQIQLRNGELHRLIDWKCANTADKDTIDIFGARFMNRDYTLTIDTIFQADALQKIGNQIAKNFWNHYTEECQYKKNPDLANSGIMPYFEPYLEKEEMYYMAIKFARATDEYDDDHIQKYNSYAVVYLPYIDQYMLFHMDGNVYASDMRHVIEKLVTVSDDNEHFSGTLLSEEQRIANSRNYQWMEVLFNEVSALAPEGHRYKNYDYSERLKNAWEEAMNNK